MSKIDSVCGKLHHDTENVENRLCGLEREPDSKNLRNSQSQLWKRLQTTVDSGGVGNLIPEDFSAFLLVGNES